MANRTDGAKNTGEARFLSSASHAQKVASLLGEAGIITRQSTVLKGLKAEDSSVSCASGKLHRADECEARYFARTGNAWQEGKSGKAIVSSTDGSDRATAARPAERPQVAKEGTLFAGLRKPTEVIVLVVTRLASGCPVQAIVHAFGLDERTVARWRDRAGAQCERVHQAVVEQGQLDLGHVQADEMRVKGCGKLVWMGLAIMVSTRLLLAGVVSPARDRALADRLLLQV